MLSPSLSVNTSDGAPLASTSSRRRALSYLRNLSHTRSSAGSPTEPRTSPRDYFARSISYHEPHIAENTLRRSISRPNERPPPPTSAPATEENHERTQSAERSRRPSQLGEDMARHRPSGARRTASSAVLDADSESRTRRQEPTRSTSASNAERKENGEKPMPLPTIRFFPHQEIRSNGRQSLNFAPVSRTLPVEHSIIRVGRYSEREGIPTANPTSPSDAPVGFKSKVVSRKHCEFSFVDGQWHIKDVASSSGTFLNHIRLSQPNTESRLFPIKDGDIVQLGIDFRGGEEMIFRCVKIRIECNRAWQKKPNAFNKSRHAQLQMLAKDQPGASTNSGECSICLGSILPNQSLFYAPCAHTWHYKCIRPLLEGKNNTYPQFQCPNCRAYSDLSADVDVAESDMDDWMDTSKEGPVTEQPSTSDEAVPLAEPQDDTIGSNMAITPTGNSEDSEEARPSTSNSGLLARRQANNPASPEIQSLNGLDMPTRSSPDTAAQLDHQLTRTDTPDGQVTADQTIAGEGPLTPRNNAGPFVFDGSAGRSGRRVVAIPEVTEG